MAPVAAHVRTQGQGMNMVAYIHHHGRCITAQDPRDIQLYVEMGQLEQVAPADFRVTSHMSESDRNTIFQAIQDHIAELDYCPEAIRQQMPGLGETESTPLHNKTAYVQLYDWTGWVWYLCESSRADPNIVLAFVCGLERGAEIIDLRTLRAIEGPARLRVKRNLMFLPTQLANCPETGLS
jgi:hypothetical protein